MNTHTLIAQATIITENVPPPDTEWGMLIAKGVGAVFVIASTVRMRAKKAGKPIEGWRVPILVAALCATAGLYQVGYSDPLLLAKHTAFVFMFSYGGVDGIKLLLYWVGNWAFNVVIALWTNSPLPGPGEPPKLAGEESVPPSRGVDESVPAPPPLPQSPR